MKLLEERIMQEGQVRPGNVLKVDCFLNHQLDVDLLDKVGEEFYRIFKDDGINKILTIEASGIAIACMAARHFNVPVVFVFAGLILTTIVEKDRQDFEFKLQMISMEKGNKAHE